MQHNTFYNVLSKQINKHVSKFCFQHLFLCSFSILNHLLFVSTSTLLLCAYFSFTVFFSVSDFFNFPAFQVVVIKVSSLFPNNLAIYISTATFPEDVIAKPLSMARAPFTVHQSWMHLCSLMSVNSAFDFLVPNPLVLLWFPAAPPYFPPVLLRSCARNSHRKPILPQYLPKKSGEEQKLNPASPGTSATVDFLRRCHLCPK